MLPLAVLLARLLPPALGVILGLLGFATRQTSLLGWPLFIGGVLYAAAAVIVGYVLRRDARFPEGSSGEAAPVPTAFRLLAAGLGLALCLAPLEQLYLRAGRMPLLWLELSGACLVCLAGVVLAWARYARKAARPAAVPDERDGRMARGGFSWFVRHAGYAAGLLVALGLVLGYGSLWGAAALLLVVLPAFFWCMRVEDRPRISSRLP